MSAPITQALIAEINAANMEHRAAREAVREATALVPITEKQEVRVGIKSPDAVRTYAHAIAVPVSVINLLIRDRRTAAESRLAAAVRRLHQLNVQVPA